MQIGKVHSPPPPTGNRPATPGLQGLQGAHDEGEEKAPDIVAGACWDIDESVEIWLSATVPDNTRKKAIGVGDERRSNAGDAIDCLVDVLAEYAASPVKERMTPYRTSFLKGSIERQEEDS